MDKIKNEVNKMTDKQFQMVLEAIKIIVKTAPSKDEALESINQIQAKGIKKPQ